MKRHVIILAQGQQTRLPSLAHPKQLLPLPLCGDVPLLARTLVQVRMIDPTCHITVVSRAGMYAPIFDWKPAVTGVWPRSTGHERLSSLIGDGQLETTELPDPGNSSLKGCSRYLDYRRDLQNLDALPFEAPAQTVILLGDVCYSWRAVNILMSDAIPYAFVGTSDLSESAGELWGVTFRKDAEEPLYQWLKKALRKHPPFTPYQCGQLRQWMFVGRAELEPLPIVYVAVDDYTKDFDVPSDLEQLPQTSGRACMDDADHDIWWGPDTN